MSNLRAENFQNIESIYVDIKPQINIFCFAL